MLEALRRSGVDVLYSSALVPENLLVARDPPGATLLERAIAAARASGLELRQLAPGRYVINRAGAGAADAIPSNSSSPAAGGTHAAALDAITIFASRYAFADGIEGSIDDLTSDRITDVPAAATDVVKAVRTLPGAASADDVRPHIRGSPQDDVLVLYDHIPIADPYHLHSFHRLMSAFDASVVGGMNVYSGGFPARFGARSGGVLDIRPRTADGSDEYSVSAGTVTQRLSALGQAEAVPLEWLGALRRSVPRYDVESFGDSFDRPTLVDGLARLQWRPSATTSWTAGVLSLDDRIDFHSDVAPYVAAEDARARYHDGYAWLAYETIPESAWQSRTSLSAVHSDRSRAGTVSRPDVVSGSLTDRSDFQGVEAATEWVLAAPQGPQWDLGAQLGRMAGENEYRRAALNCASAAATFPQSCAGPLSSASAPREIYYAAHGSVRIRPDEPFEAEAGLRLDGQDYLAGSGGIELSPRLNLRYRISPDSSLYASWGRFSQDQRPNEWRLEENQQSADPVQMATQTIVGFSDTISRAAAVRVEWYRNHWTHVHPYFDNLLSTQSILPDLTPDRVRIAPAVADADGVELSARGKLGASYHYSVSYTWSRVIDEIAGVDVPRSWDQRSAFTAGLGWQRGPYAVSGFFLYHSGWPRTPIAVNPAVSAPDPALTLGTRNSGNWSDYVSADLRITWVKPLHAAQIEIFAEATNLANRANPSSAAFIIDEPGVSATPSIANWMPRQFYAGVTWTMR